MKKIRFSWSLRTSIIGIFFILLFLRLSYWQLERHRWKLDYIAQMRQRLEMPVENLSTLNSAQISAPQELSYRRLKVSGQFDFPNEVLIRNRKFKDAMGVHALTPMKIDGSNRHILVNRGFIPLSKSDLNTRKAYQKLATNEFVGLVKASVSPHFFAPADPPSGKPHPWVERWLRPDLDAIAKQLPYPILPFYLETMETSETKGMEQKIVDDSTSGRDEIFMVAGQKPLMGLAGDDIANGQYPIPVFDTVIPPGRHFGYIFEWAILALFAALMTLIMQLKKTAPQGTQEQRQ